MTQLDPQFDAVLNAARKPAIWFRRTAHAVSASKLGGLPNLPPNVPWPRHGKTGLPLHFLAQIDLGSLPRGAPSGVGSDYRLPPTGLLCFFADLEEEMLWEHEDLVTYQDATRVVYVEPASTPTEAPADLPEINHPGDEHSGQFSARISLFPEAALDAFLVDTFVGTELYFQGEASRQADLRTIASIERASGQNVPIYSIRDGWKAFKAAPVAFWQAADERLNPSIVRHQMLGAATNVQGIAAHARAEELVPLLQLDSDLGLHESFMFCDMGMVQYWIRAADLDAGRFENAWATTEGG